MTDFVSGLDGVSYECSFLSNPRMKFFADRIENLDLKGKTTGTLKNFSYLEPGLGKIEYTSGASAWIAFSDDLSAFAIANMEKVYDCTGTEAGATFSETNAPTTLTISGHPTIAKIAVEANTITLYSADGTKIGERQAFRFLPHAIGFIDENFKDGFLLLSREKPGGWWMEGNHLGTGVRTDKGGIFQLNTSSPLRNFVQRSVQFPKVLLRAKQPSTAEAQEHYAVSLLEEVFKDDGAPGKIHGYKEIGMTRANHLDREAAIPWYEKAHTLAMAHLDADPKNRLHYITLYGDGLADVGEFDRALEVLREGEPLLGKIDDVQTRYLWHEAIGKAEFGARRYEPAIEQFESKAKLAEEANFQGVISYANMEIATCYRAAGNTDEALAALDKAIAAQDKRQSENPKANYDTYRLAFACAAFERWDDALRFAPLTNRRSSVTYQEYARLAALWNRGDAEEATKLAKLFASRFGDDLDEVLIRRDMDTMTVRLTEAIAQPSSANSAAFSAEWDHQKESLKKRPLENYLFALVLLKAREMMP
ncbi:MAG: tetratricopeptide repeat protein [Verrucomicrobiae bacterium]|nr:tetratricopeptide repeat protein [Verrucomicrobiae bacterium]